MTVDITINIAGEAGQGLQSLGYLLAKTFTRGGYHIFADQDYESRIRGGSNFFRLRLKDSPVHAISEQTHILIALNPEVMALHQPDLVQDGRIIFDGSTPESSSGNGSIINIPLERLAVEHAGNKIMFNSVAIGAVLALTAFGLDILTMLFKEHFKTTEIAEANIAAAKAGYDYVMTEYGKTPFPLHRLPGDRMMLLNGNEALSLGAVAAGCRFMSAYPMTPASSIMEFMAQYSESLDLVMVHAEDEIAAVNMAIGASFAGVRAMTATSGSGFCLMTEGLGLSGITETPLVIVNAQRPGPCVGLPTRTEQADLLFVMHAHHGEFPRAVLAPASVEDAFYTAFKAFNWADRYQIPVIILTDQHLASSYTTVKPFDTSKLVIDRGELFKANGSNASDYKRHALTASGISPRAFPGFGPALVVTDADEHDEAGHLTEDASIRNQQVEKRLKKLDGLKKQLNRPQLFGPAGAEITLTGWGSSLGALLEAAEMLTSKGMPTNVLHITELLPFPAKEVAEMLGTIQHGYVVESNATGQLHRLIRAETGLDAGTKVSRYDGRPLTPAGIFKAIRGEEA